MGSVEDLQEKIKRLEHITVVYEKLSRLTEQELSNAYEMIKMYEAINDFTRKELIQIKETAQAREAVSELGSDELKKSFARIGELEKANKELQNQRSKLQ
ncbi:MAG: hypothetical protein K8S54_08570 [Spirochaetia bacterium]|nr:hypothetical protein [Spirochaetia bacterium]